MFRKLVGNLSFSPSLVGRLSNYAKSLKKQKKMRLIAVYISILALFLQMFGIILSKNNNILTHESNILYGGVMSKEDFIRRYKQNDLSIRALLSSIGISKNNIETANSENILPNHHIYKYHIARVALPNISNKYYSIPGLDTTLYVSKIDTINNTEPALLGVASSIGNFAILLNSGDILTENLPKNAYDLYPNNVDIKTTINNNSAQDYKNTTISPNSLINYTIDVKNILDKNILFSTSTYIGDILEYADVVNISDGDIDDNKTIHWINKNIPQNSSVQYSFSVRVKSQIPTTAQNPLLPHSYDCKITSTLPGDKSLNIPCSIIKQMELKLHKLPHLSETHILLTSLGTLLLSVLLYIKSNQYYEEIRLIRHNINKGNLL
ncbi:MAG: hypothetical protein ACFNUB_03170 [Candidatus Saccharibacteria bacterium]